MPKLPFVPLTKPIFDRLAACTPSGGGVLENGTLLHLIPNEAGAWALGRTDAPPGYSIDYALLNEVQTARLNEVDIAGICVAGTYTRASDSAVRALGGDVDTHACESSQPPPPPPPA